MNTKTTVFDVSEILDSEEMIAEYLSAVIEENDTGLLLKAIGHIAKARGMSKIASDSGLGRESLYKALDEKAQPRFETVMKVLTAMKVKMNFTPVLDTKKSVRNRRSAKSKAA